MKAKNPIRMMTKPHPFLFQTHPGPLFGGSLLHLLGVAQVVFLGELEVAQKLRVHPLHLVLRLGRGFTGRIAMMLPVLIVIGVILGLGHGEPISDRTLLKSEKEERKVGRDFVDKKESSAVQKRG